LWFPSQYIQMYGVHLLMIQYLHKILSTYYFKSTGNDMREYQVTDISDLIT
jgi:hypothetical protein